MRQQRRELLYIKIFP